MMTSNFNFDNLLNIIQVELNDLKFQCCSTVLKTCPKRKKVLSKIKRIKKNRYFHEDSECEEIEKIRNSVTVSPFSNYFQEETQTKEWIVKTPIKKHAKNTLDSLITKKKKRFVNKTNHYASEIKINRNLFQENIFNGYDSLNENNNEVVAKKLFEDESD